MPTSSIARPSKIYPNPDFWFENMPSGNPAVAPLPLDMESRHQGFADMGCAIKQQEVSTSESLFPSFDAENEERVIFLLFMVGEFHLISF
jgi:hypothetical protein